MKETLVDSDLLDLMSYIRTKQRLEHNVHQHLVVENLGYKHVNPVSRKK